MRTTRAQACDWTVPNPLATIRRGHGRWLLAILLVGLFARTVSAQTFLTNLPDPAQVIAEIGGSDEIDAAARRWGALNLLRVQLLDRFNLQMPAVAKSKFDAYEVAMKAISSAVHARGDRETSLRFGRLIQGDYAASNNRSPFSREILAKYSGSPSLRSYIAELTPGTIEFSSSDHRLLRVVVGTGGVVSFAIGMFVASRIGKARYGRVNEFGVETFNGYGAMLKSRFLENIAGVLGLGLVIFGMILFGIAVVA
jgi:hypothetical protein